MGQSRFTRTGTELVRSCTTALLWLVPALALCDDQLASTGDKPNSGLVQSLSKEINAPAWPQAPAPPSSGDDRTRSQLTGDWFGLRDDLAAHGLTFRGDITQYYQGVTSGGREQQFKYGGRVDYLINFDSQKMGLWDGGRLDLRGETRQGQDTNRIDGVVAPSNFAMALPLSNQNVTALTGVQFTQDLSDHLSVFAGKLNLLDGTPATYAKARRLNSFWNTAMQSNLSRAYLFPSVLGAGITVRDEMEPVFHFFLLDTHYTPTTSGFPNLFSNGVVMYGEYQLRTNWFGLPGHSAIGFLYSNATRRSLDSNPFISLPIYPPMPPPPLPTKSSAWSVNYRFDQVLYADPDDPKRRWTLNGDLGLSDGDPNPIRWFGNLSLVGSSPLIGREDDTFGIGYYHIGASDLVILRRLGLAAEDGVEVFYNMSVTPWCHVTPDLQILDPAQRHFATAILVGIRVGVSF